MHSFISSNACFTCPLASHQAALTAKGDALIDLSSCAGACAWNQCINAGLPETPLHCAEQMRNGNPRISWQ
jgi:hypothetical protein